MEVSQNLAYQACRVNPPSDWNPLFAAGSLLEINPQPGREKLLLAQQSQQSEGRCMMDSVNQLRRSSYSRLYPEVEIPEIDPFDASACVIYTCDQQRCALSTARVSFDGVQGIPERHLVPEIVAQYRQQATSFAELGRFVIDEQARGILKQYFRCFYYIARQLEIEVYLMFVQHKWIPFYRRLMRAEVVADLPDVTFGSGAQYSCMAWKINQTTEKFIRWSGAELDGHTTQGEQL